MSTPEIRATCVAAPLVLVPRWAGGSALALLVPGVLADHHHHAVAADDLALLADCLDARSYLHVCLPCLELAVLLLVPVCDPSATQVVGRDLYLHAIAGEDADPVHAHFAGAVGKHLVAILELDTEHGVGKRFDDRSLEHDR